MEKLNIKELNDSFPFLTYCHELSKIIGKVELNHEYNDEIFKESFEIEIILDPTNYPIKIYEISNTIEKDYEHRYIDGSLCLASSIEQQLFLDNHSLSEWIDKYVISYFISYLYKKKYGIYPFGDRRHGQYGNLEFLKEYFKADDEIRAFNILHYIKIGKYRGHNDCPCGSKIKIRNCHKDIIINCLNKKSRFDKIYDCLIEEYKKYGNI